MLSGITLENFKAFETQSVELRPITVIVGPNNSGKSSLLAPVRLLVQTIQSFDYSVPLLLDGPLGDFGTFRDVVYGNDLRRRIGICLAIQAPRRRVRAAPAQRPATARRAREDPGFWETLDPQTSRLFVKYRYRARRRELVLEEARLEDERQHLVTASYSKDADRLLLTRLGDRNIRAAERSRISRGLRLNHFLPRIMPGLAGAHPDEKETQAERRSRTLTRRAYERSIAFMEVLENIDYVGAMRLAPERTYQYTGEAHNRVGAHGQNWASMFAFAANQTSRNGSVAADLNQWLKKAGLAARIGVEWLSDRHYEIRVQHPVSREYENLADVGQGNSQVLPVLVAGFSLQPGSVLMVEEPEIHLHPRAQAELGDFFYTLYRRGVQSLIETHSEYVLLRLQRHVAAGNIPPDDIVFYYVQARGETKRVTKLKLDEKGAFVKPLPGGFFPERLDEAKALARLRGRTQESS